MWLLLSRRSGLPSNGEDLSHARRTTGVRGSASSPVLDCWVGTGRSLRVSGMVSFSVSPLSPSFKVHPTAPLLTSSLPSSTLSLASSLKKAGTLALCLWQTLWPLSVPSRRRPSPSYQNLEDQENSAPSRTSHSPSRSLVPSPLPPSIPSSTLPSFHARGVRSLSFSYSSPSFLLALKSPFGMLLKPSVPFPYTRLSGRLRRFGCAMGGLPSTLRPLSGQFRLEEFTASSTMRRATSCARGVWGRSGSGSMTTSFSGYFAAIWRSITRCVQVGLGTLGSGVVFMSAGVCGGMLVRFREAGLMRCTRIVRFLCRTSRAPPLVQRRMRSSRMHSVISTTFRRTSVLCGSARRTGLSARQRSILGCGGISTLGRSPLPLRNARNIVLRSRTGGLPRLTPWRMSSGCTVSSFTPAWLSPKDERTSPDWRPCSASPVRVHMLLATHLGQSLQTSTGGTAASPPGPSRAPFPLLSLSTTSPLTLTQALALESGSPSATAGVPGGSSQGGRLWTASGTLDGLRRSVLSSSLLPRAPPIPITSTSGSTVTMQELLEDGRTDAVGTLRSMGCFGVSTTLSEVLGASTASTRPTCGALITLPTRPPEASTLPSHFSSLPFRSTPPSLASLLTPPSPTRPLNFGCSGRDAIRLQLPSPSVISVTAQRMASRTVLPMSETPWGLHSRNTRPFTLAAAAPLPGPSTSVPKAYDSMLTPAVSPLRPHCLSEERLLLWRPFRSVPQDDGSAAEQVRRIHGVLSHAWAPSTQSTYGAGLLAFHLFCDRKEPPVPESLRGPASEALLLEFISVCAGSYSGSTLKNYYFGIKAWHTLHGLAWSADETRMSAALTAGARLAPPKSKKPKRAPYTPAIISTIRQHLNLSTSLDAAVFACLTTTFWSVARLGEFTVPSLTKWKQLGSARYVCRAAMSTDPASGRLGLPVTSFKLPWSKTCATGETVQWSPQEGDADPAWAMANHLSVNAPGPQHHLFSWVHPKKGFRPLSRKAFDDRIAEVCKAAEIELLKGHGLRVGGVLEYLLRGVPFDVVKNIGRWASDAFTLYLRQHANILAPYIQASPILEPFLRITMPSRVR
ncbi:hypothetical protein D9611_002313 [Ephemerocybe angulata]|uniref:Uncharacterized protein n=1 Tax=Ephemerocybe angulata TaxID=980116 RepID=A0A8H5FE80_9AGAR|nr:hypothetical protein D9611_014967 [Tulosesus angulatus]KAF5333327.1 hypothetical protein D9611_002313 [Tulosesus angulatus]